MKPILILALVSAWLGAALLLAAAVAPAAFATLPTRALAGAVVGRVLPVLFVAGIGIGLASATLDALAPRARFAGGRIAGTLGLAGVCAVAQFAVGPRIHRLQQAIGGPIDALAADDARRVTFGRLHGASVALLAGGIVAAAVVAVFAAVAARARP